MLPTSNFSASAVILQTGDLAVPGIIVAIGFPAVDDADPCDWFQAAAVAGWYTDGTGAWFNPGTGAWMSAAEAGDWFNATSTGWFTPKDCG